jgi:hypothetical protein
MIKLYSESPAALRDFLIFILFIAHNVFLENGAKLSKNSSSFAKGTFGTFTFFLSQITALVTLGAGENALPGTDLR